MAQAGVLPEGWQQLPEVGVLVEQAAQEAVCSLVQERDALKAEVQHLAGRLEGFAELEPEQIRQFLARQTEDKERRLQAEDEHSIAELQERIAALEAELHSKNRALAMESVASGIRTAVAELGEVHKEAWPDILARGHAVFLVNDAGEIDAPDSDDKDGASALSFSEWARQLHDEAPHLFKATGRGADELPAPAELPGSAGRPIVLHGEQAKNPQAYRRARELAARRGVQLVIQ